MMARQPATPLRRGPTICLRFNDHHGYPNVLCGKGYLKGADAIKPHEFSQRELHRYGNSQRWCRLAKRASGIPRVESLDETRTSIGHDDFCYHP